MYNLDIISITRNIIVPDDKLQTTKMFTLDYTYDGQKDENNVWPSLMIKSISEYEYPSSNEIKVSEKSSSMYKLNDIFSEILDKYYKIYLNDKREDLPILEHNILKDDAKLLNHKCYAIAGNLIYQESRIGSTNVIIVPNKEYEQMLHPIQNDIKIIINPTNIHKDKIFMIRVDSDMSAPGLTLFTSKKILNQRFIKLSKIMENLGRNIYNIYFNYILCEVGINSGKSIQCIHLFNN